MDSTHNYTGRFLQATAKLNGTWFDDTIIFILTHDPIQGVYGVILNRLSHIPAREVFTQLKSHHNQVLPFFLGGPVEEQWLQMIQLSQEESIDESISDNEEESDDDENLDNSEGKSFYNVDLSTFDETMDYTPYFEKPGVKFFLGYSGWSQNQLENEIQTGLWDVFDALPYLVLNSTPDELRLTAREFREKFETP